MDIPEYVLFVLGKSLYTSIMIGLLLSVAIIFCVYMNNRYWEINSDFLEKTDDAVSWRLLFWTAAGILSIYLSQKGIEMAGHGRNMVLPDEVVYAFTAVSGLYAFVLATQTSRRRSYMITVVRSLFAAVVPMSLFYAVAMYMRGIESITVFEFTVVVCVAVAGSLSGTALARTGVMYAVDFIEENIYPAGEAEQLEVSAIEV